jgi:polyisoprenoid-binding protein YceI
MFSVRHVMVSVVRGRFNVLSGHLNIDEQHPELSWVDAQVDVASIDTQNEQRDAHLRNADFFETDKYPLITFKSTQVSAIGDQNYKVVGDLSIHGVTKQVTFDAEYNGQNSMTGKPRAGLSARAKISRKDFGLTFGSVVDAGNVALGDVVTIEIDVEAIQQVETAV